LDAVWLSAFTNVLSFGTYGHPIDHISTANPVVCLLYKSGNMSANCPFTVVKNFTVYVESGRLLCCYITHLNWQKMKQHPVP